MSAALILLACFAFGILAGALALFAWLRATHRLGPKIEIVVNVHWKDIAAGLKAEDRIVVNHQSIVDWNLIHQAVWANGLRLMPRSDDEGVTPH